MNRYSSLIGAVALAVLTIAPASAQEAFELDALIAAAKAEAPITVYAVTGKIVETADAFTAKYGVTATGITSTAKFRDNEANGFKLGICGDMAPFSGVLLPGYGMIAAGTKSPYAARLLIRYLLTEHGIAPQAADGKISSNSAIPPHAEEASGVTAMLDQLMTYDTASAATDFDMRQDWQDFWRIHYSR